MSKRSVRHEIGSILQKEVRSLAIRKLRQQRIEQETLQADANRAAYSKLHKEIVANIQARRLGRALISVPLDVYGEIVTNVTNATKQWPSIAWDTIKSTLEKAQLKPHDGREINAVVDEFVWAVEQNPFTLDWVDTKRFQESVYREIKRSGVFRDEFTATLNKQMEHAAMSARCGILNTARRARERVGIAIDEYLITQQITVSLTTAMPNNAKREARKLDTQAMYKQWCKEYRILKKNRPNMSDVWYSQQIAKMEIAHDRNANTIRKQMKK